MEDEELLKKHDRLYTDIKAFFDLAGKRFSQKYTKFLNELLELERELTLKEEQPHYKGEGILKRKNGISKFKIKIKKNL